MSFLKKFFSPIKKIAGDVGDLVTHPSLKNLENVGHDVLPIAETAAATFAGVPLPLAAAGVSGINTATHGGGIGDILKSAGTSAALAYGGQQLAGQFPETSASISNSIPNLGISDAVSSLASHLGIDAGTLHSAMSAFGFGGDAGTAATGAGGAGVADAGFSGPTSGVSALSAPTPVDLPWTDVNESLSGAAGSNLSSPLSANVGAGTVGTPNIGSNLTSEFAKAAGGAPGLSSPVADSLAAPAAAGAAPAAEASSFSKFIDHPSFGGALDMVKANPGAALSAAALGGTALMGNKPLPGEGALKSEAAQLSSQGTQLQGYLNSGTLPPGMQQGINQASEAAKATIRSKYASMGMSGSSAEQQELSQVDSRAQAQASEMAQQLLTTGINESGMASELYSNLMGHALQQDQQLSSALASFAGSMAGGTPTAATRYAGGETLH